MTTTTTMASPSANQGAQGILPWFAVSAGVAMWAVHITGEASLVRLAQLHPGVVWAMHGLTAFTALVTIIALLLSIRYARWDDAHEGDGTPAGRTRFLGLLGVIFNVVNLMLILLEGLYVVVVERHA
jgi:hypothetical protein